MSKHIEIKDLKGDSVRELTEADVSRVTGGASDYLLEIDGIKGEALFHSQPDFRLTAFKSLWLK